MPLATPVDSHHCRVSAHRQRVRTPWQGPDNPTIHGAAALALAQIGAPAVPTLVGALDSDEISVRQSAIEALGEIGPEARDAVPALTQIVTTDESTAVKYAARKALASIQPR